jgi:hypothetical protein
VTGAISRLPQQADEPPRRRGANKFAAGEQDPTDGIKLPRPEFIVLCKGPVDFEEKSTHKLSDALEAVEDTESGGEVNLELVVKLFNINKGRNQAIMEKCPLRSLPAERWGIKPQGRINVYLSRHCHFHFLNA